MMIDMHTHLWLGRYEECKKGILKACEVYSYIKAYVSSIPGTNSNEAQCTEGNDDTAKFIKEYPNLIGGYCYCNPRNENSLSELRHYIEDCGMVGMKLWVASLCDDPIGFPLIEYCIDNKLPILLHAFDQTVVKNVNESRSINVRNLAMRYPQAKIMMAHFGGNERTGIKTIEDCPNVFVDICGVLYRCDTIDYTVKKIGAGRLLYGTDLSTYTPMWQIKAMVEAADLTDEERDMIYYKNAQSLGL
ncbi:MAG: amidohydrolase family protein [Oscillospiraceae bacterium]|nr:amidohydrolase family protein [Oscillospiraceae bacterium]